ncbi:hypothetical protein [Salinisphaera hydrothermalis]|uniref:UrcA family protein n=1 Tax=Salinisphaera hydrothermalis (strain C41B8) TaxID=1304275 RepID=A0A084IH44_SALHC|nr:hypothetical protein [Salinisphaera hydrothermalis]KEZ76028.1 hypothetical protein C41B8_17069 [Salinisphaera hydrothermalis C41B8]
MSLRRRIPVTVCPPVIALVVLISGGSALAASAPAPFRIAAEHAGYAAKADKLETIQTHLHHVLNCLEGPPGRDSQAAAGDPCHGKAALDALPHHSANRVRARKAIKAARIAVTLHDEPPAHYLAQAVQAMLTEDL